MFKLTDAELQNAYEAVSHHGYSAMLPPPHEWKAVVEKWPEVKDYLAEIDLDTYNPYKPLRIFAPKSRANIRVVHLLHPEDLILYTATVLIIKDDLEMARMSRKAQRVFLYRVDSKKPNRLYDARGAYDAYLEQLHKKTHKTSTKFVSIADIADFYPRIYQHRLENVVESTAAEPSSAGKIVEPGVLNCLADLAGNIPFRPEIQVRGKRIVAYPADRNTTVDDVETLEKLFQFTKSAASV